MKKRSDVMRERPEGRLQDNRRSRSQLRREAIQKSGDDGRIELHVPRPKKMVCICLHCGNEFHNSDDRITACPKCASPMT